MCFVPHTSPFTGHHLFKKKKKYPFSFLVFFYPHLPPILYMSRYPPHSNVSFPKSKKNQTRKTKHFNVSKNATSDRARKRVLKVEKKRSFFFFVLKFYSHSSPLPPSYSSRRGRETLQNKHPRKRNWSPPIKCSLCIVGQSCTARRTTWR